MGKRVLYIVSLLVIITLGIIGLLRTTYVPQPVKVITPSFFDRPEEIGAVVYRRFYSALEQDKIVAIGIPAQPTFYQGIPAGFLEAAAAEKKPFEQIIIESQMPPLNLTGLPSVQVSTVEINTKTEAEFSDLMQKARASGKRVLIYLPSVFSTHLLRGNPLNRYEQTMNDHVFSITVGPLALRPDQEYIIDPVCVGEQVDGTGLAPLGCAEMQASRGTYRKHYDQNRYVALLNEQRHNDYLLLVSYPGQNKAEPPAPTPPAKPDQ